MTNYRIALLSLASIMTFTFSGCSLIGDIFEAGVWTAVIVIILVVLVIGWLIRKIM